MNRRDSTELHVGQTRNSTWNGLKLQPGWTDADMIEADILRMDEGHRSRYPGVHLYDPMRVEGWSWSDKKGAKHG